MEEVEPSVRLTLQGLVWLHEWRGPPSVRMGRGDGLRTPYLRFDPEGFDTRRRTVLGVVVTSSIYNIPRIEEVDTKRRVLPFIRSVCKGIDRPSKIWNDRWRPNKRVGLSIPWFLTRTAAIRHLPWSVCRVRPSGPGPSDTQQWYGSPLGHETLQWPRSPPDE